MILDDLDRGRAGERMSGCMEHGQTQILQIRIVLQGFDSKLVIDEFSSRQMPTVALEFLVVREPVGNSARLICPVVSIFEHVVL